METVLVINAGSSSLKFQLFGVTAAGDLQRLVKGLVDGVGTSPRMRALGVDGVPLIDQGYSHDHIPDLSAAAQLAGTWLSERQGFNLVAVGHRVVQGGPDHDQPLRVDESVLRNLERFVPLAPLHQPGNLEPIRMLLQRRPDLPQVACFDTGFHRGHTDVADYYALPRRFHGRGVRRYGFHGLSYEYVSARLREVAPKIADQRVIVAHLGNGASMCAIFAGRSIETTMGFTALDGLPMGTRCGQIDPGVILHLMTETGMTATEIQDLLYRESGLKGLSGISSDVRDLLESDSPQAAFALDYFVYRVGLYAGTLAAALNGLDAFVFTAGIGENSALMRARIVEKLAWLGAELDPVANAEGKLAISTSSSRIVLLVVPTDEELMIARHTLEVISKDTSGAK